MDAPPQAHENQGINVQTGFGGFDIDFGEWMNVSMGSLYDNEFDSRPDIQHRRDTPPILPLQ